MHNRKVLNDKTNETDNDNCNCHSKDTRPLPNSCQTKSIIYHTNLDCNIAGYKQNCYFGSCETAFEDRFRTHKKLLNHVKYKYDKKL